MRVLSATVYLTDKATAATVRLPAGTVWTADLGRRIVRPGAWKTLPDPEPEPDVDVPAEVDEGMAEPARRGPGSSRDVWAAYADHHGITVPDTATRDDIIDYLTGRGIVTAAD